MSVVVNALSLYGSINDPASSQGTKFAATWLTVPSNQDFNKAVLRLKAKAYDAAANQGGLVLRIFGGSSFQAGMLGEIQDLTWDILSYTAATHPTSYWGYGPATGGTFTLTFDGETTGPIIYNASPKAVANALTSLPNIGAGNVHVTSITNGWRVAFQGKFLGQDVPLITTDGSNLTFAENPVTVSYWQHGTPVLSTKYRLEFTDGLAATYEFYQGYWEGGDPRDHYIHRSWTFNGTEADPITESDIITAFSGEYYGGHVTKVSDTIYDVVFDGQEIRGIHVTLLVSENCTVTLLQEANNLRTAIPCSIRVEIIGIAGTFALQENRDTEVSTTTTVAWNTSSSALQSAVQALNPSRDVEVFKSYFANPSSDSQIYLAHNSYSIEFTDGYDVSLSAIQVTVSGLPVLVRKVRDASIGSGVYGVPQSITSNKVEWTLDAWTPGQWYESPDITSVVTEMKSRGFTTLFVQPCGGEGWHEIATAADNTADAPQLMLWMNNTQSTTEVLSAAITINPPAITIGCGGTKTGTKISTPSTYIPYYTELPTSELRFAPTLPANAAINYAVVNFTARTETDPPNPRKSIYWLEHTGHESEGFYAEVDPSSGKNFAQIDGGGWYIVRQVVGEYVFYELQHDSVGGLWENSKDPKAPLGVYTAMAGGGNACLWITPLGPDCWNYVVETDDAADYVNGIYPFTGNYGPPVSIEDYIRGVREYRRTITYGGNLETWVIQYGDYGTSSEKRWHLWHDMGGTRPYWIGGTNYDNAAGVYQPAGTATEPVTVYCLPKNLTGLVTITGNNDQAGSINWHPEIWTPDLSYESPNVNCLVQGNAEMRVNFAGDRAKGVHYYTADPAPTLDIWYEISPSITVRPDALVLASSVKGVAFPSVTVEPTALTLHATLRHTNLGTDTGGEGFSGVWGLGAYGLLVPGYYAEEVVNSVNTTIGVHALSLTSSLPTPTVVTEKIIPTITVFVAHLTLKKPTIRFDHSVSSSRLVLAAQLRSPDVGTGCTVNIDALSLASAMGTITPVVKVTPPCFAVNAGLKTTTLTGDGLEIVEPFGLQLALGSVTVAVTLGVEMAPEPLSVAASLLTPNVVAGNSMVVTPNTLLSAVSVVAPSVQVVRNEILTRNSVNDEPATVHEVWSSNVDGLIGLSQEPVHVSYDPAQAPGTFADLRELRRLTFSFWFKIHSLPLAQDQIIFKLPDAFYVSVDSDGYLNCWLNSNSGFSLTKSSGVMSLETWYKVDIVYDGLVTAQQQNNWIYVNLANSTNLTAEQACSWKLAPVSEPFVLGCDIDGLKPFDGTLDEFRVSEVKRAPEWRKWEYYNVIEQETTINIEDTLGVTSHASGSVALGSTTDSGVTRWTFISEG